jgi:SNF2 family DNA or RNA helicase
MSDFFREIPPYYEHQNTTLDVLRASDFVFDASDPGTAKTRPALGAFIERRKQGGKKALVLAPKSILQPAWGDQIDQFFPGTSYMIAYATNRKKALFDYDVDIYVTNHDAVRWLADPKNVPVSYWDDFDTIIFDESTAYKNHNSKRSKAAYKLAKHMKYRECLTGTPNPNSVTELWHQVKLLDDGLTLGTSFWKFRSIVCEPKQVGPGINHIRWDDKEGSEFVVFDMLEGFTVRHKFEECTDIPANFVTEYRIDLAPKLRRHYDEMVQLAATMMEDGQLVSAVHASAVHQKLMQMASGAVYNGFADEEHAVYIDDGRAELVMDLIEEREQCVVAFNWRHQKRALLEAANKRDLKYAVIDGSVNDRDRIAAVEGFQRGDIRAIFAHPQSAGHGLTLTKGTTTIWTSPTYNAEHYKQFNHRIYRAGQTRKTETIHIAARNTIDEQVYDKLGSKLTSMQLLLDLLQGESSG